LAEFEIILVSSFDEHIDGNVFLNVVLIESILQHFVVIDVFVIMLSSPSNLGNSKSAWVDGIHDLSINRTSSALLNFG